MEQKEIGEILAEFESHISYLEMSQPNLSYVNEDIEEIKKKLDNVIQPEWTKKQWDIVQQLQAEVRGWRQKHAEMMLALDKRKKDYLYESIPDE